MGVFVLPYYPFVAGTRIVAAEVNADLLAIRTAFTAGIDSNNLANNALTTAIHGNLKNHSIDETMHSANQIELADGTNVEDTLTGSGVTGAYTKITATATFPVQVAHGKAYIPKVVGRFRGYDGVNYSQWMQLGESLYYSSTPGTNSYWVSSYMAVDTTNINIHIVLGGGIGLSYWYGEFSAALEDKLWLHNSSGVLVNTWTSIEVEYRFEK